MALPKFASVTYYSPFAPLPIAAGVAGVTAQFCGAPTDLVAYAQLLANYIPVAWGTGNTANAVTVRNPAPLAPGSSYILQAQFGESGKNPENLDWSDEAPIASAPVMSQQLRIAALAVTPSGLTVSWEAPAGAACAAFIQLIGASQLTGQAYLGLHQTGEIVASFTSGTDYAVVISAILPIKGDMGGTAIARPFTIGEPTPVQPIPTGAPSIGSVTFDGGNIAVTWTAPALPPHAAAPCYEVLLLDGADIVASAVGGPTGAQLVADGIAALANPQVAARMSYGAFVGPAGAALQLYRTAPTITGVTIVSGSSATITAQLSSPGALPSGGALVATLYTNGVPGSIQSLDSATGSVTFSNVTVDTGSVYAIDVALVVTASSQTSTGPCSPRLTVPLTAPQAVTSSYDGQTVVVNLSFAARDVVSGYAVTLSAEGGTSITVNAGSSLPIGFPANLDVAKSWTASVMPLLGIVTGMASGAATVVLPTIAAPALTSVAYDGEVLSLQWSAAVLPFLSGYRISVSNGPSIVTAADQTCYAIPLTPTQAKDANVTVTGMSPLRNTAVSTAVAIVSSVIQITSVTVGSEVTVAQWIMSPTSAAVRAELAIGDGVDRVLADASATGVCFTVPTPAAQPYRLLVRATSADGVASGPVADVDLILTAPVFMSGDLADGWTTLRWDPVNTFGVTRYLLTATPATDPAASVAATDSQYQGLAPAAFFRPGVLTITPCNARCMGPAASVNLLAPGTLTNGTYDGSQFSVTVTPGANSGAGDLFRIDVAIDGTPAASQILTPPLSDSIKVAVAIPPGARATARLSAVGPITLAPASAPAAIPSRAPVVTAAAYDGAKLHVTWQPTPGLGVDGYLVSVAGASPAIDDTYVPGDDSFTTTIAASLTYPFTGIAVSIRAAAGNSSDQPYVLGPSSLAVSPVSAGSAYSVSAIAAGDPPYVFRRGQYQVLADVQNKPIVLYLPKPFSGAADPTVPDATSPTFQLAPSPAGSELPYQLTIGAAVWSTLGAEPVRTSIQQDYVQFLTAVETEVAFPWAIGLIRQLIAQAMPQTFEEVLYYRYGLWRDNSSRLVDLTPGTRLQLSNALYQAIVGGSSQKNGFHALGNETMEIVDAVPQGGAGSLPTGAARTLSVDAFLSLLYPGGETSTAARVTAAGPIDFFDDANRQAYYRLFYPSNFPSSGSNGSTALTDNVALIGTTSWSTMTAITQQYSATGTFPTNIVYFATYFRGRASLSPLINVAVQGAPRWVKLGTTVRQLLAAQGLAPLYGGKGSDALTMLRAAANMFAHPSLDSGLTLDPVDLGNANLGSLVPLYWPLDMPVVGGDQVSLRQL